MKNNIGILAVAEQRHGGTLLYTLSMIDALSRLPKQQYRVVIFTASGNHEYDHAGLDIVRIPGALAQLGLKLMGRNVFAGMDQIVAPVYSMALLYCGRPFMFTLHDLQERYFPGNFSIATRLWRQVSNRLLTARASRVICESAYVKQDILKFFGVPECSVSVVPAPPIAILQGRPPVDDISRVREKFGLPHDYLFYPAQFWPHKNHARLIEAFQKVQRRYPGCSLVLTGQKRDEFERVFALVGQLGLKERVRHIGYVEQGDLAALYAGAAVAVIPTLFESISIPVYEAFSVGTPVCVSNVVALPEQVGDAGLLFDPLSADDMAGKICALLGDAALRRSLIERGHARMTSVTHAAYADRLEQIIEEITSSTKAELRQVAE